MGIDLQSYIRDIPDFPKPGIIFKDIMPLLRDPKAMRYAIESLAELHEQADVVCAIDARGFIFGAPVALHLDVPFVPLRKAGKLPGPTDSINYALEYGEAALEMQADGIESGNRVVVIDDVLATGGTARAAAELIEGRGGELAGYAFLMELAFLDGRSRLIKPEVASSLITYA